MCISLELKKNDVHEYKKYNRSYVIVTGKLESNFCSKDIICPASCNEIGLVDIKVVSE